MASKNDPECKSCGNDVWELADERGYRECAVCGAPHPRNPGSDSEDEPDAAPPSRWDRHRRDYECEFWPDDSDGGEDREW